MEAFQAGEELATEHATKNFHRQEERIKGPYPAAVVWRQAARWNGAVNMRMEQQVLSPSVKDADYTDFRTEVFGIACYFQQCLGAGGEQQVVKHSRVVQRQYIKFVRHGEYDMKVAGGEKLALTRKRQGVHVAEEAASAIASALRKASLFRIRLRRGYAFRLFDHKEPRL